ncbi:hypothetical protein Tco_0846572 [Tanacetum coccineum]
MEITTTIDGKVKVVSKAFIRRHLKLEDFDSISTLPTLEIFEQLVLIGNMKRASEGYTRVDTPLFQTMLVQGQILQGEGSPIPVESHHTPISAPSTSQPPTLPPSMQTTHIAEETATMPHESSLLRVHSLGSDEGSMTLNELTVLCTTLSKKVETLESDLKQTKLTYGAAYTKLIMKVKKLEHKVKSSKARRRVRLVVSEDEDELEDPSKQGRKISQIDEDEGITLVQMSAQTHGRHEHDFEESDFEFIAPEEDYTAEPDISTANVPVSTAGAKVSTASPEVKTVAESLKKTKLQLEQERLGLEEALRLQEQLDKEERQRIAKVHEEASTFNAEEWDNIQAQIEADEELAHSTASPEVKTAAESLVYIRRSATKRKGKGKAIMKEAEPVQKNTKLQLDQERLGLEEALRLHEQLDEEERQRIAKVHEEASTFNAEEWDNIQAQIEADKELAHSSKIDAEQELNQESSKRQNIGEGSEPAEELKD